METTPTKKGSGLEIALVIVLALGIGTAIAYNMRKKGKGTASKIVTTDAPPVKPKMDTKSVLDRATSVEDIGHNKLKATMSDGKTIILPKPSGIKYTPAPEMIEKLKVKYGTGQLYQKGKTLTDGFDYITDAGEKIFITMKDLFDMAKMQNDTGDIMSSSFNS